MVKIARLVNNEEVIGQIEESRSGLTIKNGAVIVPVGEGQMAMVPWLPHSKSDSITIPMDKVMFTFEPLIELANEYSSKLGSGLVVPPPGAGIPNLQLSSD